MYKQEDLLIGLIRLANPSISEADIRCVFDIIYDENYLIVRRDGNGMFLHNIREINE